MIKINLGCGSRRLPPPWVNCDHARYAEPDYLFDFGEDDWPFDNGSADEIDARHCLEHTPGTLHVMLEAYRVLIPGGKFVIEVPHPRSDYFMDDPTHVKAITGSVLNLFNRDMCLDWRANGVPNTPLALQLDVDFKTVHTEHHLNDKWHKMLANPDGTVKNEAHFNHAIKTYNNVIDSMKFVLERV